MPRPHRAKKRQRGFVVCWVGGPGTCARTTVDKLPLPTGSSSEGDETHALMRRASQRVHAVTHNKHEVVAFTLRELALGGGPLVLALLLLSGARGQHGLPPTRVPVEDTRGQAHRVGLVAVRTRVGPQSAQPCRRQHFPAPYTHARAHTHTREHTHAHTGNDDRRIEPRPRTQTNVDSSSHEPPTCVVFRLSFRRPTWSLRARTSDSLPSNRSASTSSCVNKRAPPHPTDIGHIQSYRVNS
jgi:hypothetical protein